MFGVQQQAKVRQPVTCKSMVVRHINGVELSVLKKQRGGSYLDYDPANGLVVGGHIEENSGETHFRTQIS